MKYRSGTQNQENLSIYCKAIPDKYQVLNLNSEDICVERHQLIRLADYGMWDQANACQFSEDIRTRFLTSISMQLEPVW